MRNGKAEGMLAIAIVLAGVGMAMQHKSMRLALMAGGLHRSEEPHDSRANKLATLSYSGGYLLNLLSIAVVSMAILLYSSTLR